MKALLLHRQLFATVALAALASGCAAPQESPGSQIPSARLSRASGDTSSYGDLLYVTGNHQSFVLTYPAGQLVAKIPGAAFGTCSDTSGDVYITHAGSIDEYAHGGTTPIASTTIPGTAFSCSVDPTTGDVAVVVYCDASCKGDVLAVLSSLDGAPTLYKSATTPVLLYCGYDASGNLFVDGYKGATFGLLELAAGASDLSTISLGENIAQAGQVQWDGEYLTIERDFKPRIYQISINSSVGTIVNTIDFVKIGKHAAQSWIANGDVIIPTATLTKRPLELGIWAYPKGKKRLQVIKGFASGRLEIDGVTLSLGSSDLH